MSDEQQADVLEPDSQLCENVIAEILCYSSLAPVRSETLMNQFRIDRDFLARIVNTAQRAGKDSQHRIETDSRGFYGESRYREIQAAMENVSPNLNADEKKANPIGRDIPDEPNQASSLNGTVPASENKKYFFDMRHSQIERKSITTSVLRRRRASKPPLEQLSLFHQA